MSEDFDYRALAEQSQRLQRQIMEAHTALADVEVVGHAEQVSITLSSSGEPLSVQIDPAAVDPDDVVRLEKQVLAAVADAQAQLRRTAEAVLAPVGELFGRMP